jgi:uncharacterized repeat protein (TIGR03803 family)
MRFRHFYWLSALLLFLSINLNSFGQFQKIFNFDSIHGSNPSSAQMVFDGKWLYGTTYNGGTYNKGVVFKIMPDGSNITTIYSFGQNLSEGYYPYCHLVKKGAFLFGTALFTTNPNKGVVFKVDTNGNYSVLHTFTGSPDGATPWGSLSISGDMLFGTTTYGAASGRGTIFRLYTNGNGYRVLKSFDLNPNGAYPYCAVTVEDTLLYGVTLKGGNNNKAVFFKLDTSGNNFAKIREFDSLGGWNPYGEIIIVDDTAYGLTSSGGDNNFGVIYKMSLSGNYYQKLHSFGAGTDGRTPFGSLLFYQNSLYGATNAGGTGGFGTLFKIKRDGSQYEKILDFDGGLNGKKPGTGSLLEINGRLFGTTQNGGNSGAKSWGIIFSTDTVPTVITSIGKETGLKQKVFPNPTNGSVTIENAGNSKIEVFDITGRLILQKSASVTDNMINIDLSLFNPGIYLLRTVDINSHKASTFKIVLQ